VTLACKDLKTKKIKNGYKIFQKIGANKYYYVGFFMSAVELDELKKRLENGQIQPYKTNKWITDTAKGDLTTGIYYFYKPKGTKVYTDYPTGMHIFVDKKDAKKWLKDIDKNFFPNLIIKEVDIQNVVATGYTENNSKDGLVFLPTAVCKKIKIKE